MAIYSELSAELELLAQAKDWRTLRSWFAIANTEDERVQKCLLWGRFFLPDYFRDDSPEFHTELIKENFSKKNEFTAAPRGFAKTTINQLCIAFEIANRTQKFIVIIEKTHDEASEVVRGVTSIFKDNPAIQQVYGLMVKKDQWGRYDEKNKDAEGDVFINGVRLRAKGFNAPIRGLKSNEWRPTKIYLDDVETDEHIHSEEQRKKYRENYSQGIVPAIDIEGSIKMRGTILHNDSLLKNLIDQFHGSIYKAFDKDRPELTLLWPQYWTLEKLMDKKLQMEMEGKGASKFYQEYLNEPVDDENRTFHMEWFNKTFKPEDLKNKVLNRYAVLDVAQSKKDNADFTAVVIVDIDSQNNWYIQRAKRYKVNITELVDLIFEIHKVYRPQLIGVEKLAFIDQIKPLLDQRSQEQNIFPVVQELEHGGKRKEDRIRGALQGRFELGKIYFKESPTYDDQQILKSELFDFPHSKNDDLSDDLAYVEQIATRPFQSNTEDDTSISIEKEFWLKKKTRNIVNSIRKL